MAKIWNLAVFTSLFITLNPSVSDGQTPIIRRGSSVRKPLNAAHERAKIKAEKAYHAGNNEKTIEITTNVLRANSRDDVALYLRASARVELGQARADVKILRAGIADARESIRIQATRNLNYYLPYLYGMTILSGIENKKSHAEIAVQIATKVLSQTSASGEDRANLLYQRGMAYSFLQRFDQAARDYSSAIRANPKHLGAYIGAADAYAAAGNKTYALTSFGNAVKAYPSNPLVYNNRGMYLHRINRDSDAIADFTRALEVAPDYFMAYTNRGFVSMESGKADVAEVDFTKSLKINPNQPMVHSLRGTSRLIQGKLQDATADYSVAVQANPRNPMALADLGFAHFFAKDFARAIASFEQAMKIEPELRYLQPWRNWAMAGAGDSSAAIRNANSSLQKKTSDRDWIDRLVLFVAGRTNESQLLSFVDQKDKTVRTAQLCEAHFFIGKKRATEGNSQAANQHFQQALATNAHHLSAYRGAQFALNRFASNKQ